MNAKTLLIFISIFIVQFVVSCNWRENCFREPTEVIEMEYKEILVVPWNVSGYSNAVEVSDTVRKLDFGVTLTVVTNRLEAYSRISNYGFSAAMADDCNNKEYVYEDPVDFIEIIMIDQNKDSTITVTGDFVDLTRNESESINNLVNNIRRNEDYQLKLGATAFEFIPEAAKFTVNMHLISGSILSDTTDVIYFKD